MRKNSRSDISIVEVFRTRSEQNELVPAPVPSKVRIDYFTLDRKNVWTCLRDGDHFRACQLSQDGMSLICHVALSRLYLGEGPLLKVVRSSADDASFPAATRNTEWMASTGIDLWKGPSDVGELESESVLSDVILRYGYSAYRLAVLNGFEGTEEQWLASLVGPQGVSISSVEQTTESQESGGENVITVILSNGQTATFSVRNGAQGIQGIPGVANARYKAVAELPEPGASTMDYIYLTPSETTGVYNMSYTEKNGNTYSWKDLGTTAIQLSDYAKAADVSRIEAALFGSDEISTTRQTVIEIPTFSHGFPPKYDGSNEASGYFRRYEVDLTGAYAAGYRTVRFWGYKYQHNNAIVAGLTASALGDELNDDGTRRLIPEAILDYVEHGDASNNSTAGYFELPIAANTKYLIAAVLTAGGVQNIGARYVANGVSDPSVIPESVTLLKAEIGDDGLVGEVSRLNVRVQELEGGSGNVIDTVKVNGVALIPESKKVDIPVPTALSQLSEDSTHRLMTDVEKAALDGLKDTVNGGQGGSTTSQTVVEIPTFSHGFPPRYNGSNDSSGYFRRYEVDLTGAYAAGYRTVRFWGFKYQHNNAIVAGMTASALGDELNDDGTRRLIPEAILDYVEHGDASNNNTAGYFELPIAANTKYLIAAVLTAEGARNIGDRYVANGVSDPSFIPESVTLSKPEAGDDGLVGEVSRLNVRVRALESQEPLNAMPETYFPRKIYGIIGEKMQEFVRGIVKAVNPYNYYSRFMAKRGAAGTGGQGMVFRRYYEVTPELVGGEIPVLSVSHQVIDDNYNKGAEKTAEMVLCKKTDLSVPQGGLNVLCIGASTTRNGQWPGELYRRLTANDGTPEGFGMQNINFVGRKTGNLWTGEYEHIRLEATGGWRWRDFFTPRASIRFTVTGNPTVAIDAKYTFIDGNGATQTATVAEVNVSGEAGDNIMLVFDNQSAYAAPAAQIGTLTPVGGGNDIAFTAYEIEDYAPFYDVENDRVSFVPYVNQYCGGKLDVVCIYLGSINSGIRHDTNLEPTINDARTLIDAIHSEFPNCKILVSTTIPGSDYFGYEEDYGAGSIAGNSWDNLCGAFRYSQAIDNLVSMGEDPDNNPYSDYCYIVNLFTEVDSEYVFPLTTKAVNTRMPGVTEVTGTNGAHPNIEGYYMIADSFFRTFCNVVLNNQGE